ncbi:PaaI family thioesterase [Neorhodopirellula lusitana]|uniref:PaaI family thioesterase n=1 Tax=Neorhodopirellula lusitana TaxID=445327 RepID=UPI00384CC244
MYESTRDAAHPTCIVCGKKVAHGLGIEFLSIEEGSVETNFDCQPILEGYPAMLHGGIICMLLDGAMTNSLFTRGIVAVTADISVRFRKPVSSQGQATLRARVDDSRSSLFFTSAELLQEGEVKATAKARFVKKPAAGIPSENGTKS